MKPRRAISSMSSRGIFFCSSISAALGSTFSRAKSRAVRCTSSCSAVRERSNPAAVSVVVVVAMAFLQRVDADVTSIGVAREEEVAEEFGCERTGAPRAIESRAHVGYPEPHDEARLPADLLRCLAMVRVVHDDLRVRGVEPHLFAAGLAAKPDDLAVELRDRLRERTEHHHRADLRPMSVLLAHAVAFSGAFSGTVAVA